MKNILIAGWLSALATLVLMLLGHQGTHALSWDSQQISTYAANAPYDYLITTAMLSGALMLLSIGILVSRTKVVGDSPLTHLIAPLSGAAAAGLLMLAYYEETARGLAELKRAGFWSIRIQSFHDAGLDIFFYSALLLITMLGLLALLYRKQLRDRLLALLITCMGPLSYYAMTTAWPGMVGLQGNSIGLKQRVGLFCLWLGVVLFLAMASAPATRPGKYSSGSSLDS